MMKSVLEKVRFFFGFWAFLLRFPGVFGLLFCRLMVECICINLSKNGCCYD